ncbi:UbiA prenyltransferase family [Lophiotrema nucula]|uniref:UbiA prenyltransferase family n=1 Tax=Lophiotrema nucula TaxID=690887 RepID=A0A6A5Z3C2_9PLEO|nr:UbiA prenyltransferase family [Lophiotrema nucula]
MVPNSWVPLIQLTRLYTPAAQCLIYLPHLFGILYAAVNQQSSLSFVIRQAFVVAGGSFFFSNAAHIWDDLVDAPLDSLMERTRKRPLPRGAITHTSAFLFAVSQAVGALLFFTWFPVHQSYLCALPSALGTLYYPWAKRHTNFPQLVLGLVISWGCVIGALSMGHQSITTSPLRVDPGLACLTMACACWTMIYDSIYARLDLRDDIQYGIGSTAVAFGDYLKLFLWILLLTTYGLLVATGAICEFGYWYDLFATLGATGSLAIFIARVDLKNRSSCWSAFTKSFWYFGGFVAMGLLLEYASS